MESAFGVDHAVIEKGWVSDQVERIQTKRTLKAQKKFNNKYPIGDNQQVRVKDARAIRWRDNITDQKRVKSLKSDIKARGQLQPITIGRHESNPLETVVWDGHHRLAAHKKLRSKTITADVHAVTYPRQGSKPAPLRRTLEKG